MHPPVCPHLGVVSENYYLPMQMHSAFHTQCIGHRCGSWREHSSVRKLQEHLGWVLLHPLEHISWHAVMLLLPQCTSGVCCSHLILPPLTRGKNRHFPTFHHLHPPSSASCLPNSQPLVVVQGQPRSLNRVKQYQVPVSPLAVEFRGSFSLSETLNCHIRLFLGRKMSVLFRRVMLSTSLQHSGSVCQ